ncbi:MAG TPA: hypothetical protein VFE45_02090 [Coriobacteriia bacterium]|nr:hypothetical protein [Coriobacteriia bacterium]
MAYVLSVEGVDLIPVDESHALGQEPEPEVEVLGVGEGGVEPADLTQRSGGEEKPVDHGVGLELASWVLRPVLAILWPPSFRNARAVGEGTEERIVAVRPDVSPQR